MSPLKMSKASEHFIIDGQTYNALPWLLTNSGLFEKNFANYQLGGPIDNLRSFFKMLLNLPDT